MPRTTGARAAKARSESHGLSHAAQWLDDKLTPLLGPPPLGPYGAEDPHGSACPLCGQPLTGHRTENSEGHVFLYCSDGTVTETGRAA
jgi:hypothetical protein